jgi:hypothetical protein
MRHRVLISALCCLVLLAPIALTQTTGDMGGVVRDKDGTPLPGATVAITGPGAPKGRSATTLSDGSFRFDGLIPGTYHLKATLSGMGAFEQDVVIELQRTTDIRPVLATTVTESITVTGAVPLVDTKATTVAAVTTTEQIEKLPIGRTFTGTFQLAPGVADSGVVIAANNIGVNAGGGRQDNQFFYDGVNVTNPFFADLYQDFAGLDIQEVNITRAGVSAEFGRTGGFMVNGVTKSGTNAFHGEARVEFQPKGLQATSDDPNVKSSTNRWQPGANVGGPILKDSLFFFGSVNFLRQSLEDRTNNLYPTVGAIPNYDINTDEYFGKLTVTPVSSVLIDGSFRYQGVNQANLGVGSNTAPTAAYASKDLNRIYVGSAFWTVNQNMSIEAKFNRNELNDSLTPNLSIGLMPTPFDFAHPYNMGLFTTGTGTVNGVTTTFIYPPATSTNQTIGLFNYQKNNDSFFRNEYRLQTSYLASFLGSSHEFKAGVSYSDNREELSRLANGWGSISVSTSGNCGPVAQRPCFRARLYPEQPTQISRGRTWGVFLQDQATWNRVTLNVGALINHDTYIPNDNGQFTFLQGSAISTPNSQLKPCSDPTSNPQACTYTGLLTFDWSKQIQPRAGVAVEIDQKAHDKFYVNYGRYDNLDNQSIARAAAPVRIYREDVYVSPTTGQVLNTVIQANQTGKIVLPHIDPTYTDEFIGGYERPLGDGWSASVYFQYRKTNDIIEDFASTGNNFVDQNPANFRYGNLPAARRYYRGGTLEVKRVARDWTMDVSYTLSKLSGNWDLDYATQLYYASSYIGDGPGLNPGVDSNREGTLIGNRTHVAKVFATYSFPTNTQLGGFLRVQSGRPWEARGFDPVYGGPGGPDYLYLEKAGSHTTPTWANFDFIVSQNVPISSVGTLRVEGRVYNLFNSQPALAVYQDYCSGTPCGAAQFAGGPPTNPLYGKPSVLATPRRFAFALDFLF